MLLLLEEGDVDDMVEGLKVLRLAHDVDCSSDDHTSRRLFDISILASLGQKLRNLST